MSTYRTLRAGVFLPPFHPNDEDPLLCMERDFELMQWLDAHNYAEAWIGEHHSGGYEIYGQPELFIATAAERTRYIRLGTGVISLPYHHPLMVADRIVQLGKEPRLLKSEILKLKEIFDPMRLRRLDVDRGHDQLVIDQLRSGAGSQQTPRWRKMDSNFQYGRGEFGLSPLFPRPVAWTGRCGRSGVPRFRVFVRRVAEAVDGHPEPGE